MKEISLTKLTKVINERENKMELIEYPTEDLFEDGELDASDVEEKIIWLWRRGYITIARWEN